MNSKGKKIYSCTIPVRWGDMDAIGHVNNALYLRYMEEARVGLLTKLGANMDGSAPGPVIINVHCTFMRQIEYPDTLRIDCYAADPGRSSFMLNYEIYSEKDPETLVSEGYTKVVWVDHSAGRSVPLPAEIRVQID